MGSLGCISHCRRDCRIQGSGSASIVKCTVHLLGRGGLGRSFGGTDRDGAVRTVVRVWWRNFGRIQRMLSVLQTTAMRSARCVQRSRFLCSGDAGASREHRSSPGPESSDLAPGTTARALRPAASSSSKTPPDATRSSQTSDPTRTNRAALPERHALPTTRPGRPRANAPTSGPVPEHCQWRAREFGSSCVTD